MSKLTFRADNDLVRRLEEEFDASKSEVLREALREYIEHHGETSEGGSRASGDDSLDELLTERIDSRLAERARRETQDINVNITLDGPDTAAVRHRTAKRTEDVNAVRDSSDGVSNDTSHDPAGGKTDPGVDENTPDQGRKTCTQCGETLSPSHVYCPNCGEKSAHRVFCECGDELRSDWAFCPGCGRRTPAADVLDGS